MLTQNVHERPQTSLLRREVLSLDAGNRTTQYINGDGEAVTVPSVIKTFDDWEDLPVGSDESPLIQIQNEDFQITESFVIGEEARIQKGKPAYAYDKIKMAKYLVYAALEPLSEQSVIAVDRLLIALPDSRNADYSVVLQELEGTHNFIRNGQRLVASIRKVELIDETKGAYAYGIKRGLFQRPKSKINGILDLGGGTVIGRLYSPGGQPLREYDLIEKKGTFALANKIASAMQRQLTERLEPSQIMDAIANQTFTTDSGVNFVQVFDKCRESWVEDIRASIRVVWSAQFKEIGEVLIVGGSAPLAKSIQESTKNRFRVVSNHQTISIEGMQLL